VKFLQKKLTLETNKQLELIDITDKVAGVIRESSVEEGSALIFAGNTTASIRVSDNEPLLLQDITKMLYRLVPVDLNYAHDVFEIRKNVGEDERTNGHAHAKAFLLGSSEAVPVVAGKLALSDAQSVFFVELDGGRKREFIVQISGA
jgi:secondary thiamine-phosphate synthase enzyme